MNSPDPVTSTERETAIHPKPSDATTITKFILFSLIGIFAFFAPLTVDGERSIPIDIMVSWLIDTFASIVPIYALLVLLVGAIYPFITKTWNETGFEVVFSILKILGLIAGLCIFFEVGPEWLLLPHMGPFLFYDLIIPIGLIVPISGLFLTFLIGYGLLEFIGVFFQKIMRPLWKVPGRSVVHALTSRFASIVVVYLMVNQDYKEGKLTAKEAVIIATGFLAVEIPFLIIIARTIDIMHVFPLFFLAAMVTTFFVTAIMVRIWPFRHMENVYTTGEGDPEKNVKRQYFAHAWRNGLEVAAQALPLSRGLWNQFKEAMIMILSILPSILSIGLIGLILAEYTPIFDYLAYLLYPLTWLLQVPESLLAAKAISLGITEILLPSLIVVEAGLVTKFIVATVSVSGILFFSTSIPCILASDIPVSVPKLIAIWFIRTVMSIVIAAPLAYLLL